ncbi:MAG: zinc ribbon domain-containing protein [Ruminiclostridium sp.]|nr:zinc ribbon domain-containing protein [Ruminiclostridium sp.]
MAANARFCKACGANLTAEKTEPAKNICPNCSTENGVDDIFCAKCGTKLK